MYTKISVVMPAYNSEKYLAEAIESILNQTFKNFEFIIINDGSTDKTLKILKKYAKKDRRIRIINHIKNLGIVKTRNDGLKEAQGEYIAIMDSDDISLPERLQIQYEYLKNNKEVFFVSSGAELIDKNGNKIRDLIPPTKDKELYERLNKKNCLMQPTIMLKNQHIQYRKKFHLAEDYDFYLRLLSDNKKLANLPNKLIKCRISSSSSTYTNQAKIRLFSEKAREFYFQRLKNGKDKYASFDPKDILKMDIEKSKNKTVLSSQIRNSFIFQNFKETRKYSKKYFKIYGYSNKYIVYYLATFFGKKMTRVLIKTAPIKLMRFLNE